MKQYGGLIFQATTEYASALFSRDNLPEEAAQFVGSYHREDVIEIARRLGITSAEMRAIFPEIASLVDYVCPSSPVRKAYEQAIDHNERIGEIEDFLLRQHFFVYRCKAVGGVIYRCKLSFERDHAQRLLCAWDIGAGVRYLGTAYASERAITASLSRESNSPEPEMAFLCIGYDHSEAEWVGLFLGLTDGGYDPCSGRIVVVRNDNSALAVGPVTEGEWAESQIQNFLNYLDLKSTTSPFQFAVVADQNFLAACKGKHSAIIVDL